MRFAPHFVHSQEFCHFIFADLIANPVPGFGADRLQQPADMHMSQVVTLRQDNTALEADLALSVDRAISLEKALVELRDEQQKLKNENAGLQRNIVAVEGRLSADLARSLEQQRDDIGEQTQFYSKMVGELNRKVRAEEEQRIALERDLGQAKTDIVQALRDIEAVEHQRDSLQIQLQVYIKKCRDSRVAEVEQSAHFET